MIDACRNLQDSLARAPGEALVSSAERHLASCASCRARVVEHERLVDALRAEPAPIDDVTRARWLARMAPALDAIAARREAPVRRAPWLAIAAVATIAVGVGWWLGRGEPSRPAPIVLDRDLLRPYVVSGATTDAAATTLLAGRFASLDVAAGQLERASVERDQRIALVGPARVTVHAATRDQVELDATGTLLVDTTTAPSFGGAEGRAQVPAGGDRDPARALVVRMGGFVIRAQHATFAAQTSHGATVVFVDRGELELGLVHLRAGDWFGPAAARSPALVALLRDQENAISPPADRSGILAVAGSAPLITQGGAVLGAGPLWARIEVGDIVVVASGAIEQRTTIVVREGGVARLEFAEPVAQPPTVGVQAPAPSAIAHPLRIIAPAPSAPAPAPSAVPAVSAVQDAPPAVETAAQLYVRAESALRAGDRVTAEATWQQLLDVYPRSPQAASALYDLASLTRTRDRAVARRYLARLLAGSPPAALREPAQYLTCRLEVEASELAEATRCFEAFRKAFADSPHDAEVLAWLAGRAEETGGCAAARSLTDEYARKYPHGPFSARAASCKENR